MQYVYMLYWYDEYGPKDLVATLDRSKLPAMLDEYKVEDGQVIPPPKRDSYAKELAWALLKTDAELAVETMQLAMGWGALTLHVVPLV